MSTLYLETSVLSYLVANPASDILVAARQKTTQSWWESRRSEFEVFVSEAVFREASRGDVEKAARRLALIQDLPTLDLNTDVVSLAELLISEHALPKIAAADSLHIAVAAVHGLTFLLTWNCKHIANAQLRGNIESACRVAGFEPPTICTPDELLEIP